MSTGYTDFTVVREAGINPQYTVVLVGAALDGPANTPFTLNNNVNPHVALGQSPLADAYYAAQAAGNTNIVAYRLNGVHASAVLKNEAGKEIIRFESISASSFYNSIRLTAYPTHLYVESTYGRGRSYFYSSHKTARDLAYAINRDAFYGLVEFSAQTLDEYYPLDNLVTLPSEILFTGGDEEEELLTQRDPHLEEARDTAGIIPALKERLKTALFGEDPIDIQMRAPSSELGVLHFGVIALCDMYHDDDPELTEILGSFCLNKTKEIGFGCVAVIGTRPVYPEVVDMGDSVDFAETLRLRTLELVSLSESTLDTEAHKYVQVVVGQTEYSESPTSSVPTAYAYAATQANLPIQTMMSNKELRGIGKLNWENSKEDIALLTANGYICTVPSVRRGFVPFYAISHSKDKESLLVKPHNLRISQHVSRLLVEEFDSLVGSAYSDISIQDAMGMAKELMDDLVVNKVIRSYELRHELLERNTVLNVEASLTPFSEVRTVSSIAVISFPKGVVS